MIVLYVALGGAIGSAARFLLAGAVNGPSRPHSPAGTFVVNVLGCFAFGLVVALADRRFPLTAPARAFLLVGILGGFTTFSSYTHETFVLLREADVLRAAVNAGGQVCLGLLALWAGYAVARVL
ncbi:MAG: fluoride efflux transporter CrcB [Acidobacteriota bacterium]|jgi:CrcB protein|nr:fluoride efflux transporter CrcB [Acidobacteriota bacterium]